MTDNGSGIAAARELAAQKLIKKLKVYNMQNSSEKHVSTGGSNTLLAAGWIPVAEKLPPEHEKVLVQFGDQNILIGIMDSNDQWAIFWSDGLKADDPERPIDYWMPLPACR